MVPKCLLELIYEAICAEPLCQQSESPICIVNLPILVISVCYVLTVPCYFDGTEGALVEVSLSLYADHQLLQYQAITV